MAATQSRIHRALVFPGGPNPGHDALDGSLQALKSLEKAQSSPHAKQGGYDHCICDFHGYNDQEYAGERVLQTTPDPTALMQKDRMATPPKKQLQYLSYTTGNTRTG